MRSRGPWGWATFNGKPFREHRLMAGGSTDVSSNVAIGYYERGHVADKEHEANREFILRACNAHDDLVEAVIYALAKLNDLNDLDGTLRVQLREALELATETHVEDED